MGFQQSWTSLEDLCGWGDFPWDKFFMVELSPEEILHGKIFVVETFRWEGEGGLKGSEKIVNAKKIFLESFFQLKVC